MIGGFSQGSAMAMILLLSGELSSMGVDKGRIGGWWGASGWLPFRRQIWEVISNSAEAKERRRRVTAFVRELLDLPAFGDGSESLPDLEGGKYTEGEKIFLAHGARDVKVRPEWGEQMRALLSLGGKGSREGEFGLDYDAQGKIYEGLGHWWCEEEVRDLCCWIEGMVGDLP